MNYVTGNIGKQYLTADPDSMQKPWADCFDAEVKAGNFLIGGKSLLLAGEGAEIASQQWVACLNRVDMPAYRTTPMEIVRRLEGKVIPRDDPQRLEEFERAETVVVFDFFEPSDLDRDLLQWFFKEALRDGIVVVLVTENHDPDLDCHGENIGQFIEDNFEGILHVAQAATTKAGNKSSNGKHSGLTIAGRNLTGGKRIKPT